MTLEQNVKQLREKKNMTQAELAKKLGFESPQFISNAERGKCTFSEMHFKILCKALDIEMDDLIDMRVNDYREHLRKSLKVKRGTLWRKQANG